MTTPEDEAAPDGMTPDMIAEASAREIAAGRLPLQAQWRIAMMRKAAAEGTSGAFTSDLSTQEFAAIRSVGFRPVGQVMGSAVFNVGWSYTGCGYYNYGVGYGSGGYSGAGYNRGGFSGQGMGGNYGGYRQAPVVDVPAVSHLLEQARHRAVERLRTECEGLGGHGVVGVTLTVRPFYENGLEFLAIGTAIAGDGVRKHPKKPFTSDLSGQDFAKLLRSGWVPVDLVQGVGAVIRHNDWAQRAQQGSWLNQELVGSTALVTAARAAARESLVKDAAKRGGHTVVLQEMVLNKYETRCTSAQEGEDNLVDAFIWGTAIAPINAKTRPRPITAPIPMLRLDKPGSFNSKEGRR
jgi:uncharacterized protein YbjQ (UPF0145 family)